MLQRSALTGARILRRQRRCLLSSSSSSSSSSALAPNDEGGESNLPSKLIDFRIAAKIEGEESHVAMIDLRPGEVLRAESGAMVFMTEGVVMDTKLNGASAAFSRMLTGQNLFLTDFHYNDTKKGTVCLGTDFPSKILRFSLEDHPDRTLICQKGAYLASNPNVNIEMEFTKSLSAGFFGGQGFVLQKLSGEGDVLVKGGGTVVKKDLREGETLRVTSGSLIAFESTVQYDVQMMPGIKNVMFGGEGLFVTTLQGPGQVWLQGMPPDRMISEIARRVPGGGIGLGIPIGMGGGGGGDAGTADGAGAPGADEAAAGAAAGAAGGEDMVAATDAAVEADRNATVAASGMSGDVGNSEVDADSPSALFGDAAPDDVRKPEPTAVTDDEGSSFATTSSNEETFAEDDFSTSTQKDEPTFDESFSTDEFLDNSGDIKDGEIFDDTASSSAAASDSSGGDEGSSGFLQSLWDFFTDGDE